ncbi:MAG: glycosyltransferase, partial [bacterium]|nr:glycosyltransferase [bacterium]
MPAAGISISVVIPTLNEQRSIERALACTRLPGVERIVVDGGSRDGTSDTARFLGADRVLNALPGRAHQMDAGYRVASGEIVLFLHADTRLEVGWYEALQEAMLDPISSGGAFTLRFEAEGLFFRLLERGALWRSRKFGLP